MEKEFVFRPKDVCSQEMRIVYDDETMRITRYVSVRGCPGNSQGVGALLVGMEIPEAKTRLRGILCPGSRTKRTSCPDQLSYALEAILKQEGKE